MTKHATINNATKRLHAAFSLIKSNILSENDNFLFPNFYRGNYRSLWMGVLWALPSGTGVAVALLQGSNGPLIGVAISASLLPPVVNCVRKQ